MVQCQREPESLATKMAAMESLHQGVVALRASLVAAEPLPRLVNFAWENEVILKTSVRANPRLTCSSAHSKHNTSYLLWVSGVRKSLREVSEQHSVPFGVPCVCFPEIERTLDVLKNLSSEVGVNVTVEWTEIVFGPKFLPQAIVSPLRCRAALSVITNFEAQRK